MKALSMLFFFIFLSGSALASPEHCGIQSKDPNCPPEYRNPKQNTPSRLDVLIENNRHVTIYAPKDLDSKHVTHRHGRCTEEGFYDANGGVTKKCQDFHSASQGNWWRVRFGAAGNAEYIFKLTGENPELWVKFKPGTQTAVYTSSGAQQFAMTHSDQQIASGDAKQNTPPATQNSCGHLSGNARTACEATSAIAPALGGLLKW